MSANGQFSGTSTRGSVSHGARFILLAIVSLSLMLFDHQQDQLTRARQWLSFAVYPIRWVVDFPIGVWQSASASLADRDGLLLENEQLKRDQFNANYRLQRLAALEVENARLRELIDSTARLSGRVLIAEILSVDLDPYRQRLVVNRGLNDGVFVGQPLLDAKGLVGQIVEVGLRTSQAVLITDADHAVPVSVNRNGLRTIAVGTGDSGRLRLPYLTNSADIHVGDLLVSSGLGGVFPAGRPVAEVIEVRVRPGQSFAEVIAQPVSEFDRDQELLLVFASDEKIRAELPTAALSGLQR
jgi:rod shape-determining protein MreC